MSTCANLLLVLSDVSDLGLQRNATINVLVKSVLKSIKTLCAFHTLTVQEASSLPVTGFLFLYHTPKHSVELVFHHLLPVVK